MHRAVYRTTCTFVSSLCVCTVRARVEKTREAVMRRDGVTCMESVGLGFCLQLPILWGERPRVPSHVTEQETQAKTRSSRGTILSQCSLAEFK